MNKEFKKLKKENDELRRKINNILYRWLSSDDYEDVNCWINQLVENEINQEALCNQ